MSERTPKHTVHVVGTPTLMGGLAIRAISLEPIYTGSGEVSTTILCTEAEYCDALAMVAAGPVYL